MKSSFRERLTIACLFALIASAAVGFTATAHAQDDLVLLQDMVLDAEALLMPASASYGRAINGVAYQTDPLLTYGGFQYASWYHNGNNEDVYVARRSLTGNTWEVFDTGENMVNGDSPAWDAHNIISLGIGGDGRIHLSWDHHNDSLRYMNTAAGVATGSVWDSSIFSAERDSLNVDGSIISNITYPRFITDHTSGNLIMTYRTGGSGNGDMQTATFDSNAGTWNAPHEFINGTNNIFYDDPYGGGSNNRNAYINDVDVDSAGRIHTTWTWREAATGSSNHEIAYAYSDDGGSTWQNNTGEVVGTLGNPIDFNSPGITVVPMDRSKSLMNQQTQTVDGDGRVHTIMWHRTDESDPVVGFTTESTAYYHYFRDPTTGTWNRNELPTSHAVGSRPDVAHDADGNLYVAYVSPTEQDNGGIYTAGDLVIASASKATGYEDWQIVYSDAMRDYIGEPSIDSRRLLDNGVVSVFLQENDAAESGRTGTPLRVLEFNKLANKLGWTGDSTGSWQTGAGTDWDNDNDQIGDSSFTGGERVSFDDGAASFTVNISATVSPSSIDFSNSANAYTFTGAGIGGSGGIHINGGGIVTLGNAPNSFTGDTQIENGTLVLSGAAMIASSANIHVHEGATLDVSRLNESFTLSSSQSLNNHGNSSVIGNVVAGDGSIVTGNGTFANSLFAAAGATIQVGGNGLAESEVSAFNLIDDFSGNLSAYTDTRILAVNSGSTNSYAWQSAEGSLSINTSSYTGVEQSALTRSDVTLGIGEELQVGYSGENFDSQDIGLYVGAGTPTPDVREDYINVYVRSGGQVLTRGFDGDSSLGLVSGDGSPPDTLFVSRIAANVFETGYYSGTTRVVLATRTMSNPSIGNAIGFYSDIREAGSRGNVDDFGLLVNGAFIYSGETMTVLGDFLLENGATLILDIATPSELDLLSVTGNLTAQGTLEIHLAESAQSPASGDIFDILDFSSASGSFESFVLPSLATGLAWNVSKLLVTGELEVVNDVDLDNDGDVDGQDLLAIQQTDASLIPAWSSLYGSRLVTSSPPAAATVPEPSSASLLALGLVWFVKRRRWASTQATSRFASMLALATLVTCLASPLRAESIGQATSHVPVGLSCELLTRPAETIIYDPRPEFSWNCGLPGNGYSQTAYQLIVREASATEATEHKVVWDTGKVDSSRSINVEYSGKDLASGGTYHWSIRSWNEQGRASEWSEPQDFRMADTLDEAKTSVYSTVTIPHEATDVTALGADEYLVDFGTDAFGYLVLQLPSSAQRRVVQVRFGEKLLNGQIDRDPGGTIRYYEKKVMVPAGATQVTIRPNRDRRNTSGAAIRLPRSIGVIGPFRYVELAGITGLAKDNFVQMRVEYPFDESASFFESSDATLNAIWELCKYSIRATTFCGVYVDGDRERIPYEADAYLNQLSHYGVDREFALARHSHEYLMAHPTWPTEWKQLSVLMAWTDYQHTANTESLAQYYQQLKTEKILSAAELSNGLLDTSSEGYRDIVDWPESERDGFEMRPINTVVNAFHYATLNCMADIATALGIDSDANEFTRKAAAFKQQFNRAFWNTESYAYVDGMGSQHSSIHANLFPLAFGLVPEERMQPVVEFVKSREMRCSVYAAQFLLEGLYKSEQGKYALQLLTSRDKRSWYNMIRSGSTIALEAWDIEFKPNLDWNHAWGAAPANLIPFYLAGVLPSEPGFKKIVIQPRPGELESFTARVPSIRGPIEVQYTRTDDQVKMQVDIPGNCAADVGIPFPAGQHQFSLRVNGIEVPGLNRGSHLWIEGLAPGRYELELSTDQPVAQISASSPATH